MDITFQPSERGSLGVEMELSIVQRDSRELFSAASDVLGELGSSHPDRLHPKAKHELFECTLEVITGVCPTAAAARTDLETTLAEVCAELQTRDLALLSAGTHPFSHWRDQELSPNPRYRRLVEDLQWPARRLAIYGAHFHVGVESGERAIAIVNSLAFFLPVFVALSAASPYWHGYETGMASCRTLVFESLPTAGLPPRLGSWSQFEQFMKTLVNAQAIESIREVWWDVRPHPDFGTVELRMCDAMPTVTETVALAALAQSLVCWLDERLDRGEPLPEGSMWVVRQNKWLAARHGLDAQLIRDDAGNRHSARDAVAEILDAIAPTAKALGCTDELDEVRAIVARGPSCARQRRIIEQGGTFTDVVDHLVSELAADLPGP